MSGLGTLLYNTLSRVPVLGSAVAWFNEAEKERLVDFIKAERLNEAFHRAVDDLFDGLNYCYKTDPDVVIAIIKVSQHHNGLDHNYVIERLPEELRTVEFVTRILKEVIFERVEGRGENSTKTLDGDFVAIDLFETKLDLIKSQVLRALEESAKREAKPIKPYAIRNMLIAAKTSLIESCCCRFRTYCVAF